MSHYFTNDSKLSNELILVEEIINGKNYRFYTDGGVFSKNNVDFGSLLLINVLMNNLKDESSFLDLGSGYGPIGIVIKDEFKNMSVHLTDVNEKAITLAKNNSELNKVKTNCYVSNGFAEIKESFDVISLNPPIRAGKKTIFNLYVEASNHLNENGKFFIVIKKKHGADSHKEYLKTLFKNIEVLEKSKGYFVMCLTK